MIVLDDISKKCVEEMKSDLKSLRNSESTETAGYAKLGMLILDEANRAMQWYKGGMRVAATPHLSHSKAKEIIRTARELGIEA